MKKFTYFILLLISFTTVGYAQGFSLHGAVTDYESGKGLPDVNITAIENNTVALTAIDGSFSFAKLTGTQCKLRFEKLGYRPVVLAVAASEASAAIKVQMHPATLSFGEVTVSSTRYNELMKETPISLEVIDRNQISNSSALGITEALQHQPGLALVRDGLWGEDINIRGLSRQNVVTLIDGNRVETASNHAASLSLIDVADIDHVEVIKGGVSSLYGTGATGGVVSISTKKGAFTDKFLVSGSVISGYNSVNNGVSGYTSLSASSNSWFARLSIAQREGENAYTPDGTLPNSHFRDNNYAGSFGYKIADNHQVVFDYQRYAGYDIGIPGGKTFPAAAIARYPLTTREMYNLEYKVQNLLPGMANASLKAFKQEIYRGVETVVTTPAQTAVATPYATHKTYGFQLNTDWVTGADYHLTAGIDVWQREYAGFRVQKITTATTYKEIGSYPVPNSKYGSGGVYAQQEMSFFDKKLKLNVGARYDLIHITNDDAIYPVYATQNGLPLSFPASTVALQSFYSSTHDDRSWSANFGAIYKLFPEIDAVFNAAHAFRSPVLEERFQFIQNGGANSPTYLGNPNLSPEKGNFFDLGVRVYKPEFTVKVTGFYNFFTDLVMDSQIGTLLYQKTNIGEARIYGAEVAGEVSPLKNTIVYANAAYTRGEDTKNHAALGQIAPCNGEIGAKYNVSNTATVDLAMVFFSTQNNYAADEARTPGYTLYNLYASSRELDFMALHVKLSAGFENIFNKSYRNHFSTYRSAIKSEPGRNAFVKIEIHW
ncbi:MAG: TonB-dependent receptor [Ignavibacteria bacterium]|nr:TonB-dependent receptor [Ignavibacteria bacterium]